MDYTPGTPTDPFAAATDERATALLSQISRKRRAAAIIVPTDDARVRARLRELGEPITCFGEGPPERRDRLREYLTKQEEQAEADGADGVDGMEGVLMEGGASGMVGTGEGEDQGNEQEEFYTVGSDALLAARQDIARYSLPRARRKTVFQKLESTIPLRTHVKHRNEIKERLKGFDLYGSQIAGDRPVSIVRFAPDGKTVASGNWAGGVKLLDVPNLELKQNYTGGHTDRVGGISWFPNATLPSSGVSSSVLNLASGGGEGKVQLWSLDSTTPISTLEGHSARVCRVEFHPSGKYLASASYDTTWRLWDVETTTELLLQEGHSKEVYAVAFNGDGALLASAGLDAIGRIWDIRTGRTVMLLEGHMREIYGLSWAPDSYRVLSGSADGLAICWDVRMVRDIARIPAHSRGVTDIRWFNGTDGPLSGTPLSTDEKGELQPKKAGSFFVSCGFDKMVNVVSADDWAPIRTLTGHAGNVLGCDVSSNGQWIVSCGHDRSVKLWGRDDGEGM